MATEPSLQRRVRGQQCRVLASPLSIIRQVARSRTRHTGLHPGVLWRTHDFAGVCPGPPSQHCEALSSVLGVQAVATSNAHLDVSLAVSISSMWGREAECSMAPGGLRLRGNGGCNQLAKNHNGLVHNLMDLLI